MPIKFKWHYRYKELGKSITINLNDGDMYIMSEKTTGYDWKRGSIYTFRHCAGSAKYTKEKELINSDFYIFLLYFFLCIYY